MNYDVMIRVYFINSRFSILYSLAERLPKHQLLYKVADTKNCVLVDQYFNERKFDYMQQQQQPASGSGCLNG